jgi:3-hydroxy-9,10-secoandrosta-1,3,5(10)-triene-9,17-dione monooxygenase reductase component
LTEPGFESPGFREQEFREAASRFATGVVVVTGNTASGPGGFTAQSFTSVSLDPPLVTICPGLGVASWAAIEPTGRFCVNVLAEPQEQLSRIFATKDVDKFQGVGFDADLTPTGPVLDGVLAWFGCEIETTHPAGDHLIVVGRVVTLGVGENDSPLLYFRSGYTRLGS